jgi:glycosyltransferase involved in cell wall biosynthesis
MPNRILFFCPIPPPVGGQALISKVIHDIIQPRYLINTNAINKYQDTCSIVLKTFWFLLFHKIDLVYFTCTRSKKGAIKDVILLTLCKIRHIKVVNHLHGNEIMDLFTDGLLSKLILWSYQQIDTTIFVTEHQKQLMPASLDKMKKVAVQNCFDPIFDDIERDLSKESQEIQLLFVSYIMKSKGIFVALDVFEQLAKEYEQVTFHLAGKPLADDLMTETNVSDLFFARVEQLEHLYPQRIVYHGVVEGTLKKELFVNSDIFLFPTFFKTESFGLVNVEAMRAGMAVVTTNHNFIGDIVTKNEGLLAEPNDVNSFYLAVKYYLDNPKIRLEVQRHNVEHAKKYYSPALFRKNIINVFSNYGYQY